MPKATKSSKHKQHTIDNIVLPEETSDQEETSSDQEQEIILQPQPQPSQAQAFPIMFMPYIEGPKMDWKVNDGLFNRFLKWKLKCKNILVCELAMHAEKRKCKKFFAWSGDFGIDQYVSWNLTTEELTLDVI